MNYGGILSQAWEIAWKYKSMWILGLLAGGGTSFNWNSGSWDSSSQPLPMNGMPDMSALMPMLMGIVIVGLVMFCLTVIGNGGIVDANYRILRGYQYRLRDSFSAGIDMFFPMAGLILLTALFILSLFFVLGVAGFLLYTVHVGVMIIGLFVLIPIALFGIIFTVIMLNLAARVLMIRRTTVGNAISEAYLLFRNNAGQNLLFFFLLLIIEIAFSVVAVMVLTPIAVALWAGAKGSTTGLVLALAIGIPLGLAVATAIVGFAGSFTNTAATIFYLRLLEPEPETVSSGPEPTPGHWNV